MKNLLFISGVFASFLLFSCGQSVNEKQLAQRLAVLEHHDDSIKQDIAKKQAAIKLQRERQQIAEKLKRDKEELNYTTQI